MTQFDATVQWLRKLHGMLLASILLYAYVGEKAGPSGPKDVSVIRHGLSLAALLSLGSLLVATCHGALCAGRPLKMSIVSSCCMEASLGLSYHPSSFHSCLNRFCAPFYCHGIFPAFLAEHFS